MSAAADGERVLFSVRDTGIGIAPEHRLRIFDRFYRVPSAGRALPSGSGLGLALAKWIAERHGTQLTVAGNPGGGSCFTFALNRTPAPPANGEPFDARGGEFASEARLPSSLAV